MKNDLIAPEPETTDYAELQLSLQFLDRTTAWFWWNTIATLILLLAAMAALFQPQLARWIALPQQQSLNVIARGVFVLILLSNAFTLYYQHHFKGFRKRFVDQIQVTLKQRRRADKFYGLAILDPLTGLYNRRFGEESLGREIMRAEQNSTDLSVIAMDLDYFKEINDKYGHAAGDLVLKEYSRNLRKAIRACDLPIRIGGDEFLVVLPDCTRENLQLILSRLTPFEVLLNRQKVMVSYSRGKAQYQVGDTQQSIVQRADKSMYSEKATRRDSPA